ncbi:hypothetical protein H8R18_00705 [Nanchangia anserum]|uniref:Uncharacterized protein n=1 Tax=Nanchangia anserum TaxID=2692125 RepID=A0A8I0GGU7_9ACTO|nr:hypothetical protein [Nanchangia anserum]MBD3689764.1 hypothetical protein [Nanchangia anserum]QOX81935.1 hypothetical protein H8R18_00705 [Nanchangia anserum]
MTTFTGELTHTRHNNTGELTHAEWTMPGGSHYHLDNTPESARLAFYNTHGQLHRANLPALYTFNRPISLWRDQPDFYGCDVKTVQWHWKDQPQTKPRRPYLEHEPNVYLLPTSVPPNLVVPMAAGIWDLDDAITWWTPDAFNNALGEQMRLTDTLIVPVDLTDVEGITKLVESLNEQKYYGIALVYPVLAPEENYIHHLDSHGVPTPMSELKNTVRNDLRTIHQLADQGVFAPVLWRNLPDEGYAIHQYQFSGPAQTLYRQIRHGGHPATAARMIELAQAKALPEPDQEWFEHAEPRLRLQAERDPEKWEDAILADGYVVVAEAYGSTETYNHEEEDIRWAVNAPYTIAAGTTREAGIYHNGQPYDTGKPRRAPLGQADTHTDTHTEIETHDHELMTRHEGASHVI